MEWLIAHSDENEAVPVDNPSPAAAAAAASSGVPVDDAAQPESSTSSEPASEAKSLKCDEW